MKSILTLFLILFLSNCGQKKVVESKPKKTLTRELSEIPTFPNCETYKDWIEKEFCLTNSIQELISKNAKKNNLTLTKDTLKVAIRIEIDGSSTIMENKSNNKKLESLSQNVLENLPYIEPASSKSLDRKVTSAYSFYLIFENNEITSKLKK
ncbi:hypothetical protein KO493_14075 [Tamlana agarivorans]|uniref:Uncharacterized protein n=1 Tax=Pseudotamlana agarivorans TaxID=481183 RepID=A0ACC5UBV2_9FLAO|nr:hypothetical protein [Tamlana agarivorans]MBU2951823.1 hypothetical protein [Tamlana agarivorans]